MIGVNENNFVVLVNTILVHPVGAKDTQVTASPSNTLLSNATKTALELEVVNTLADGFTVGSALGDRLLPVTTANTNTIDNISLLSLVAKAASLVGAGRARRAVNDVELAVLPAPEIR